MNRFLIIGALLLSGLAGVSWELLWQLHTSLAIGASAQATAVVIASTMGGMTVGALVAGALLRRKLRKVNPYLIYASLEVFVGLYGLAINSEFQLIRTLDRDLFRTLSSPPYITQLIHLAMIALVLGPPSAALGATVPVLCELSKSSKVKIGVLYGVNTLGAALGCILSAFVALPALGVHGATILLIGCNIFAALFMVVASRVVSLPQKEERTEALLPRRISLFDSFYVFTSGFGIFVLEVCFFRVMRSAFLSTTHSFAIMLASVLVALFVGAYISDSIRRKGFSEPQLVGGAGILVLLVAPLLVRLDLFASVSLINIHVGKFFLALAIVGPTVTLLGILFPLVLGKYSHPSDWSTLQVINTAGAVLGALGTAWIFLPRGGVFITVLGVGVVLVLIALLSSSNQKWRTRILFASIAAFILVVLNRSGLGTTRILGMRAAKDYTVVSYKEEPDFSVAVVDQVGVRSLYIDGFSASSATNLHGYLAWMGRLPMLMHADPKSALVICFGTGETVNALRHENPEHIDVVDISNAVFSMSAYFPTNEGVLLDPRVNKIVMDGRAWLNRTTSLYDVITLEPMPPTFAGSNSLYSLEFYKLAHQHLNSGGTIAQWLPMHLVTTDQAVAITKTFAEVFPHSVLWVYPPYRTGILVGRKGDIPISEVTWPGLVRTATGRELSRETVESSVQLSGEHLLSFARSGVVITDDNQYLSYGWGAQQLDFSDAPDARGYRWENETFAQISKFKEGKN